MPTMVSPCGRCGADPRQPGPVYQSSCPACGFQPLRSLTDELERELERATKKFPDCVKLPDGTGLVEARRTWRTIAQNWCDRAHREGIIKHADVLEEEVAEVLAESDPAKLRVELVQVGAMILKWVRDIDSRPTSSAAADTGARAQAYIEDHRTRTGDEPGTQPSSPTADGPPRRDGQSDQRGGVVTPAAADILTRLDERVAGIFEKHAPRLHVAPGQPASAGEATVPPGWKLAITWHQIDDDGATCDKCDPEEKAAYERLDGNLACAAHAVEMGALVRDEPPAEQPTQWPSLCRQDPCSGDHDTDDWKHRPRDTVGNTWIGKTDRDGTRLTVTAQPSRQETGGGETGETIDWSRFVPTEEIPINLSDDRSAGAVFQAWGSEGGSVRMELDGYGPQLLAGKQAWAGHRNRTIRHADGRWADGFNPCGPCAPVCGATGPRTHYNCFHDGAGTPCSCTPFCRDRAKAKAAEQALSRLVKERDEAMLSMLRQAPAEPSGTGQSPSAPVGFRVGDAKHVALWDAVNDYAEACGGKMASVSVARMIAVARVEKAVRDILEPIAEPPVPASPRGCGASMPPWECGELMPVGSIALCDRCSGVTTPPAEQPMCVDIAFTCENCGPGAEPDDLGDCVKCKGDLTCVPAEKPTCDHPGGQCDDRCPLTEQASRQETPAGTLSEDMDDLDFTHQNWHNVRGRVATLEACLATAERERDEYKRRLDIDDKQLELRDETIGRIMRERDEATSKERARCLAWALTLSHSGNIKLVDNIRQGKPEPGTDDDVSENCASAAAAFAANVKDRPK